MDPANSNSVQYVLVGENGQITPLGGPLLQHHPLQLAGHHGQQATETEQEEVSNSFVYT